MKKSRLRSGHSSIAVGLDRTVCSKWEGTAVVVDVLRCSTTLCALLVRGKKDIRVYGDQGAAMARKRAVPQTELFSELNYPKGFEKFDNSPHQALTRSKPRSPAVVVTGAGTKAILGLKRASRILAGCFANFPFIVNYLRTVKGPVLIIPAGVFYMRGDREDFCCARAIRDAAAGKDTLKKAFADIYKSGRPARFLKLRRQNGAADMKIAFAAGSLKALPEIKLKAGFGKVKNLL